MENDSFLINYCNSSLWVSILKCKMYLILVLLSNFFLDYVYKYEVYFK